MKPPPPMLPACGCVTPSAKPTATAASTALPPALRMSTPTCVARFSWLATMPFFASTGRKRAVLVRIGACAGGAVCATPTETAASKPAAATDRNLRDRSIGRSLAGRADFLHAHDLIRKPVPTFRDHALLRPAGLVEEALH